MTCCCTCDNGRDNSRGVSTYIRFSVIVQRDNGRNSGQREERLHIPVFSNRPACTAQKTHVRLLRIKQRVLTSLAVFVANVAKPLKALVPVG